LVPAAAARHSSALNRRPYFFPFFFLIPGHFGLLTNGYPAGDGQRTIRLRWTERLLLAPADVTFLVTDFGTSSRNPQPFAAP
jgi:hypothetical protein